MLCRIPNRCWLWSSHIQLDSQTATAGGWGATLPAKGDGATGRLSAGGLLFNRLGMGRRSLQGGSSAIPCRLRQVLTRHNSGGACARTHAGGWRITAVAACCLHAISTILSSREACTPAYVCSAAARMLGAKFAAAAAAAGLSRAALQRKLHLDQTMGIDMRSPRLLYACQGMVPRQIAAGALPTGRHTHRRALRQATTVSPGSANPDPSQAFNLHSRPGAPYLLVLDFTGEPPCKRLGIASIRGCA